MILMKNLINTIEFSELYLIWTSNILGSKLIRNAKYHD
jgi:hypothetical protein